jgi:uncharacterized membrane protein
VWIVVSFILPPWLHGATRLVAGYDTAALALLTILWSRGLHSDARLTQARAAVDDPGSTLILFIVLGTIAFGLVSAIAILGHGPSVQSEAERWVAYVLATVAISAGWFLVHIRPTSTSPTSRSRSERRSPSPIRKSPKHASVAR